MQADTRRWNADGSTDRYARMETQTGTGRRKQMDIVQNRSFALVFAFRLVGGTYEDVARDFGGEHQVGLSRFSAVRVVRQVGAVEIISTS